MFTPEQQEFRRGHIGGSEIAAIVGLHPFLSPIDVWLSKVEGYQREATPDMERGIYLEDGVVRWFSARTGCEAIEVSTMRHSSRPHIGCTPDRLFNDASGASRILSVKVPGNFLSEEWGEPHAWQVPTYAYLQLQQEMAVLGSLYICRTDYALLAAPLAGNLQILKVDGDAQVQERLMEEAEAWWERHIERREPPPLDGSEAAKQWLRRRFPKSEHPVRAATPAEDLLALELQAAESVWEAADRAYERARQPIEEAIAECEGLEGPFGKVTFRSDSRGRRSLKTYWASRGGP